MSEPTPTLHYEPKPPASFVSHAKLIGFITFLSRILGLAREVIAANYFGAGAVWSAFQYAFTIPNLFRKLLGEGALSAAFIPLYTKALKNQSLNPDKLEHSASDFASASVSLLISILIAIACIGEVILFAILLLTDLRPSTQLAVKLTIVMLPYVIFICGTAFLSGILQVHRRFTASTATSIMSNLLMIIALVIVAKFHDLKSDDGQRAAVWWIAISVLVSGVAQVLMLLPSLKAAGFRFRFVRHFWTSAVKEMLRLSIPVALGAGVLQLGVVLDKQLALMLASGDGKTHFQLLGYAISLPMEPGALARLNWAQFLYQFPLGVFATALATAIFPQLSGDALEVDPGRFKSIIRQGVQAALFIGLPASAGMVLVADPCVRLLFQRGAFTAHDATLTALSAAIYSSAIWAFSLQQILNRAYYALHDMRTPLIWTSVNLLINVVVEIPLLWSPLRESGMAVGTLVSFAIQAVVMLWMLDRKVQGIGIKAMLPKIGAMLIATTLMILACLGVKRLPILPEGTGPLIWGLQLAIQMTVGGAVYFGSAWGLGLGGLSTFLGRRRARMQS